MLATKANIAWLPRCANSRPMGRHNLLILVTLRSLDGSIAKEEANWVYDLVYAELPRCNEIYLSTPLLKTAQYSGCVPTVSLYGGNFCRAAVW
jgi:hypothetical protein